MRRLFRSGAHVCPETAASASSIGRQNWKAAGTCCRIGRHLFWFWAPVLAGWLFWLAAEINRLLKQYAQMRKMMKGVQGKWLRRAMGMGGPAARM